MIAIVRFLVCLGIAGAVASATLAAGNPPPPQKFPTIIGFRTAKVTLYEADGRRLDGDNLIDAPNPANLKIVGKEPNGLLRVEGLRVGRAVWLKPMEVKLQVPAVLANNPNCKERSMQGLAESCPK